MRGSTWPEPAPYDPSQPSQSPTVHLDWAITRPVRNRRAAPSRSVHASGTTSGGRPRRPAVGGGSAVNAHSIDWLHFADHGRLGTPACFPYGSRMDLDLGVLFNTDRMSGTELVTFARRLEQAGIGSMWLAELFGREPFAAAGALLASTETLRVGTAIANVYARDATAAAAASTTLAELSGDRFELGLGVSNRGLNEMRGHTWTPPVTRMTDYLAAVRSARITVPGAGTEAPRYPIWVAAHGPKMLEAAATGADGIFTYLMTPEHTERTATALPEGVGVSPMMMCLLCPDPAEARRLARRAIAFYMDLDYYHRAWRKLGFDDGDFDGGGSDRLVDAIVAWGSIDDIRSRIEAQHEAGASQVVIIPLNPAGGTEPDWTLLDHLAG